MKSSIATLSGLMAFISGLALCTTEDVSIVTGYYPPYSSVELPYSGLIPRITSESLKTQGISTHFQFESWSRAFQLPLEGRSDASIAWLKTPQRENRYYYSKPLIYINLLFLHRKSLEFGWNSFTDLKNMKIGITENYSYGRSFDDAVRSGDLSVIRADSEKKAIADLIAGDSDLVAIDRKVAEYIIRTDFPDQQNRLSFDENPISQESLYLIAPRNQPGSQKLLATFNKGLDRLHQTGRFREIVENLPVINSLRHFKILSEENAPMNYRIAQQPAGIVTEVMMEVLKTTGSDLTARNIEFLPWSRALKEAVTTRNTILFSLTRTPEREPYFKWIGPVYRSNIVITGRKNLTPPEPGNTEDTICAVRDDIGHSELLSHGYSGEQLELVPQASLCAKMLISGRVNYWAYGRDTSRWYLTHNGGNPDTVAEYQELTESARYIAINRDSDPDVVRALQRSFDYLQTNGRLQEIIGNYLNNQD